MNDLDVCVRVVAEMHYLTPPADIRESIRRRQAQIRVQAMAEKLEKEAKRMLIEQINAEIDLATPG